MSNETISNFKISPIFQKRLKELVSDLDCKKSDLPRILSVSKEVISRALIFGIIPKPSSLIKIADKLDVSIEYLLGRKEGYHIIKSETKASFQTRFIELRNERNLKNNQISVYLHIDRSYFTIWEREKYIPSLEFLVSLSEYFKVTIDYLLGRTNDR